MLIYLYIGIFVYPCYDAYVNKGNHNGVEPYINMLTMLKNVTSVGLRNCICQKKNLL